ncbi:hypothetical protein V8E52_008820 [Russula decolorans]
MCHHVNSFFLMPTCRCRCQCTTKVVAQPSSIPTRTTFMVPAVPVTVVPTRPPTVTVQLSVAVHTPMGGTTHTSYGVSGNGVFSSSLSMSAHSRRQFNLRHSRHITLCRILEFTPHRQPSGHSIPSGHRRVPSSGARCAKLVVRYAFPPQPTPLPSRPC